MISFWERESLLNYDVIVVGSGLVGLSTAISIKETRPQLRVLVLERGIMPTGASTKNAGFACIGSLTEILDDLSRMSEAEVLELVQLRHRGLQRLRSRLGESQIDYAENGSWELLRTDEEVAALQKIDEVNTKLHALLGGDAFEAYPYNEKHQQFGFDSSQVRYVVKNSFEGELNSGKMMRALIDLAIAQGVEIKTGCEVSRIEETPQGANVVVHHSYLNEEITLQAKQLAICTNAFSKTLVSDLDVQPGRGQVMITRPIANLKFKGIYHFDQGYYYFRRLEDRVLFGGARNLALEEERSADFSYNEKIQNELRIKLETLILPGTPFEIDMWWTGIMAFGLSKFPILRRQSKHISIGARMGGMGVAMGSEIGYRLAETVVEGI